MYMLNIEPKGDSAANQSLTIIDSSSEGDGAIVHQKRSGVAIRFFNVSGGSSTIHANGGKVIGAVSLVKDQTKIAHTEGKPVTVFYGGSEYSYGPASGSCGVFYEDTAVSAYKWSSALSKLNPTTVTFQTNGDTHTTAYLLGMNKLRFAPYTPPTRTGYTFTGWLDENGDPWDFATGVISKNLTLTAGWTPNPHKITWDANGGTFADGDNTNVVDTVYDATIVPPTTNPTKAQEGNREYVFAGWYTAADGGVKVTNFGTVTGNATYYAHWGVPATETPVYAAYQVEHYLQKDDGGYELAETQFPLFGLVGTTAEATAKEYSGYRYNAEKSTASGEIIKPTQEKPEILTLKLYYDKELPLAGLVAILDDVPFVDVSLNDYFYDSVKWAYHAGVTGGTDAWHFSPSAGCTRAQAVTFLWRAAGSPAASYLGNFKDVDADAYYAPAVAWAVANGVTNGTSATTFSPDAACSRGDIVTFLYRAFGSVSNGYHPFADVPASAYYADAVAWAYEHGVTGGTSADKFSPADACSRAQIVTFLYRVLG